MNRLLLFAFVFLLSLTGESEGLKIITTGGGLQGIANSEGEVVIPPIYELLGWSNGENTILDESIGYRENGKWGLINIKNRNITNARFILLKPFNENSIEAGVLGKFSNMIFRGLIDSSAKTLLDFRYFSIENIGNNRIIVSEYVDAGFRYGLYTDTNERVIPVRYHSARRLGHLVLVTNPLNKIRIFDLNGNQLIEHWVDEVTEEPEGFKIKNEGYYGWLNGNGQLIHPVIYKDISPTKREEFSKWEVRSLKDQSQKAFLCDSIIYDKDNDLLIAHVNDSDHILGISQTLFKDQQHKLKYVGNGFLVTFNTGLHEWGIYKTSGANVVSGLDSVFVDSTYFFTKSKNEWNIYNYFGRKLNKWPLQSVNHSQAGNIPVKKNGYWGWIDFQGERIIDYKFDRVIPTANDDQFIANYLNKWGIYTFNDQWLVLPTYDSIHAHGRFYLAKKGNATHILNLEGKLIDKTGYEPQAGRFLKLQDQNKYGVITSEGVIIDPIFDQVTEIDKYLELRDGQNVSLIDQQGKQIIGPLDEVQDVLGYSEGFFHILKDGKHGFVDENGKLRIANRYDGALPYSEGLAPIKLLGKWGFINKSERLVIQPFYKNSSTFSHNLAIVQMDANYGLINKAGKAIIKPAWKNIERLPSGNYLITDHNGHKGLADINGRFVVRPSYDAIEDTDQKLFIATKGGKKGVLDYAGFKKVDFLYQDIRIQGDYMILLQAN